jgi:hypothetical protein
MAKRVKPGNGEPLKPYRWWELLSRSVLFLEVTEPAGPVLYAVDVRPGGDADDGAVRARLYRDGRQAAVSRVPARFPVGRGVIEVATTTYGVRRAHYVAPDGSETQLLPHPRSGEGRRARFHRAHPTASRAIAVVSIVCVLVGVTLTGLQLAETVTRIDAVSDLTGTFLSPVQLPVWANIGVVLLIAAASTERALRMRSSWLDELAG